MTKCDYCKTIILWGGIKANGRRFCAAHCAEQGRVLTVCDALPQEAVDEQLLEFHSRPCPWCKKQGPIDVFYGHRIWSAIVWTSCSSERRVCCRRCGTKHQIVCFVESFFGGWWGIPGGVVMTPIQLVRNVIELCRRPDPNLPSQELERLVRMHIGTAILQAPRDAPPTAPS